MKRPVTSLVAVFALAAFGAVAPTAVSADSVTTSEVTKTTTYSGTVTEAPSSSRIIVKSESEPKPMEYMLTERTTFVDSSGRVVSRETLRNQPVTVYLDEGDPKVVSKVIISKAPSVSEKRTTTTTTEEID